VSELRIERVYPIAPERLFDYVTKAENVVRWWGPEGVTPTDVNLDLTHTGAWTFAMTGPNGTFEMCGVVQEVNPPRAVQFTMNTPGETGADSIVRFEIAPEGSGSRFTLIQCGITDEMVAMGKRGWGMTLARLEKLMGVGNTAE
jgi:uncharacterized protein YndB with AHSA1/START domain